MVNKKIVLTTGVFGLLHPGHVELFEYCSTLGKVVVGINDDKYIMKKHNQILIPLSERMYLINSIKYIDYVTYFHEENACELIKKIRPAYFVKGPDYLNKEIPEQLICQELNIKYLVAPMKKKFNTTDIIKKLS